MTKKDFVLSYFELQDEEDDASYYTLKKGYTCMYNDELPLTVIMVDDAGTHTGSDDLDFELMQESEWDLISIHACQKIEYVEE